MKEVRVGTPFEQLQQDVLILQAEMGQFRKVLGGVGSLSTFNTVKMHVFENGKAPEAKTEGAIGFDAYARAVVDPTAKTTPERPLRSTFADFMRTDGFEDRVHPSLRNWMTDDPTDASKYAIAVPDGARAMVGLGFATEMQFPMFYWVAPRSGYAAKGITVTNSPGTVDPDYRGEAGALMENRSGEDFLITHHMRLVQVIFQLALMPELETVPEHSDLSATDRGAGGFGSTGTHH